MKEIKRFRSADQGGAVLVEVALSGEECPGGAAAKPVRRVIPVFAAQFRELGLELGPIDDEKYELLETAGELCGAVRRGRFLLSFGANNAATLRQKLRMSGYAAVVAAEAVEIILSEGIIDENGDAVREAELRVRHGDGREKIIARLREHGYCGEAVTAAVAYLNTVDFAAVCRRVIERKYGTLPTETDERRRAVASLMRAGFSGAQIREAERRMADEADEADDTENENAEES